MLKSSFCMGTTPLGPMALDSGVMESEGGFQSSVLGPCHEEDHCPMLRAREPRIQRQEARRDLEDHPACQDTGSKSLGRLAESLGTLNTKPRY